MKTKSICSIGIQGEAVSENRGSVTRFQKEKVAPSPTPPQSRNKPLFNQEDERICPICKSLMVKINGGWICGNHKRK